MLIFQKWYWQEKFNKFADKFWMKLAWVTPKPLAKWCAVRVATNATTGKYSKQIVPDLTAMEALQRF